MGVYLSTNHIFYAQRSRCCMIAEILAVSLVEGVPSELYYRSRKVPNSSSMLVCKNLTFYIRNFYIISKVFGKA